MASWLENLGSVVLGKAESYGDSETAETLLTRLSSVQLTQEKKKYISQLKDVASEAQSHSGFTKNLEVLINILRTDRADTEILKDVLEILISVMTLTSSSYDKLLPSNSAEFKNTEILVKDPKNVSAILDILEETDHHIRFHVIKLLRILILNRKHSLQQNILTAPMAISRLVDLLRETREIIRNEALLLLDELTKQNQDIQKLIAFEGGFEILLGIIYAEGLSEGGIIVQDCLRLIQSLLINNPSNQNYFRETSCIQKLPPLLVFTKSWVLTDDQVEIIILTLGLISILISGNSQSIQQNQEAFRKVNIISLVIQLALGNIHSTEVRIKGLVTLSDLITHNKQNTNAFSVYNIVNEINGTSEPALLRLITIALHAREIKERNAAVRVFKNFLLENEESQMALASTLTPPPTIISPNATSIGTQLISSLLGKPEENFEKPYRSWHASIMLSSIVKDNSQSKELVLKIPLEIPKSGNETITLLTKCMNSLMETSTKGPGIHMIKIGIFKFLCIWFYECSSAIHAFLSNPKNLPFLVENVLVATELDEEVLVHIPGLCALLIGICYLYIDPSSSGQFSKSSLKDIISQHISYEQFVGKLDKLRKTEAFINAEQGKEDLDYKIGTINYYDNDFTTIFKNVFDQIQKEFKGQKNPTGGKMVGEYPTPRMDTHSKDTTPTSPIIQSYKDLINQQDQQIETLKKENQRLTSELARLNQTFLPPSKPSNDSQEVEKLKKELKEKTLQLEQLRIDSASISHNYNQLEKLNAEKSKEIESLKRQLEEKKFTNASNASVGGSEEIERLRKVIRQLEQSLAEKEQFYTAKLQESELKYSSLEKEQEELLGILTEYELQISDYKSRLHIEE